MLNKLIKFGLMTVYRVVTFTGVFLMSLCIVSPLLCIANSVLDLACRGYLITGKFLFIWLLSGLVFAVPLYIYVELKAHGKIKVQSKVQSQS